MFPAQEIAQIIVAGFDKHHRLFRQISAAAKERFENGDWVGGREANRERIDFYDQRVTEGVAAVGERFSDGVPESLWPEIKQAYIQLLLDHKQPELAETFYNSVACRVLRREYYNNQYIFWRPALSTDHIESQQPVYRCYYPTSQGLRASLQALIDDLGLQSPWEDLHRDLKFVIRRINQAFPRPRAVATNFQVHVLSSLFYRNKAAYVIGRVQNGIQLVPFAIPILKNRRGEIFMDALLLERSEIGTLFSLARAYFFVDMEVPSAVVAFLRTLFPEKPPAELYTALGLQKQGKTLFYRGMHEHLKHSTDKFTVAPGVRGMVMAVFTLPSFPYVFKLIRDKFEPPKDTDAERVMAKYLLVKYHDRVGRMSDTLEYSHVAFPTNRFDPALLDELHRLVPSQLEHDGDRLIIKHLYLERRLTPLDIYLKQANDEQVEAAIREYGQAIRELAAANIFPGDLLLKNFGITRFGRVVFYDYDELCYLSEVNFRKLPQPSEHDDEMSSEPWFYVGPRDVFPEEFSTFLFGDERTRAFFLQEHGELCTAEFWQEKQRALEDGKDEQVFPYPQRLRFPRSESKA